PPSKCGQRPSRRLRRLAPKAKHAPAKPKRIYGRSKRKGKNSSASSKHARRRSPHYRRIPSEQRDHGHAERGVRSASSEMTGWGAKRTSAPPRPAHLSWWSRSQFSWGSRGPPSSRTVSAIRSARRVGERAARTRLRPSGASAPPQPQPQPQGIGGE